MCRNRLKKKGEKFKKPKRSGGARKKDKKYFFLHFVAKRRIKLRSKMESGKKLRSNGGGEKGE